MPITDDILRWVLTQGGLAVVVLVVLWSYRKDLTRIQAKDQEKTELLIDLVRNVTVALQELKASITGKRQS